jgi:diadenosine tetraphosphate (Ap4A) HIT family hydrolase
MKRTPVDIAAYQRSVQDNDCFICGIVEGSAEPHRVVYRDETAIAFLNRFPTLYGYVLVAPVAHKTSVVGDFTRDEYLALQAVVHRVGTAVSAAVPTERLYLMSLGSQQGNAHVHWHVAPLPPGVPYEQQQFASLMFETTGGYLDLSDAEADELAQKIASLIASQ